MKRSLFSVAVGLTLSMAATAGAPALFTDILDASPNPPPRTLSAFPVTINFAALDANPETLSLELPGTGIFTATRTRFIDLEGTAYHWIGKTSLHDVVLTSEDDVITGFIRGNGETYSVISSKPGPNDATQSLQRMDESAFPGDVTDLEEFEPRGAPALLRGASSTNPDGRCFGQPADPIDVLVVYSPEALTAAGGAIKVLENQVANAIAAGTVTLANSDVPVELRLARVEEAPASLVETGTTNDYFNVRGNADVAALRTAWEADVVTYLTSIGVSGVNNYCGVTIAMKRSGTLGYGYDYIPYAYNVVTWQCGIQNNDLSHETGHNVGLDHNPGFTTGTPTTALYPFAFGHAVDGEFRDDMSGATPASCPNGCPRQMFFSSPLQTFNGILRGIAGERDNAQTYRRMSLCVNTFATYVFSDGFE